MKIAWAAASGDAFIRPIMDALPHDTEGPVPTWPPSTTPDLLWCEWADQATVDLTNSAKVCPIIVRFHSYEAFTPLPKKIAWNKVDAVVFVADHVRLYAETAFPEIKKAGQIVTIPNGVNFSDFKANGRAWTGRNVLWCGTITHKKGPDLFLAAAHALHEADPLVKFHVVGDFVDGRYAPVFGESGLPIEYYGKVDRERMPELMNEMDFVLSTSPWESFQYAVAEAAACGCLALVHEWPGARDIYPKANLWKSTDHLVRQYKSLVKGKRQEAAKQMRDDLLSRYAFEDRLRDIESLIDKVMAERNLPTVSLVMIASGGEPRLRAALESVSGHVDEMVVALDCRKSRANVEVCEEMGATYTDAEPLLWEGHFDFAGNRNRAADLATGDWVFVLDSDEVLENPQLIRPMLVEAESRDSDTIAVQVDCYLDTGLAESASDLRAFRKDRCRYEYPIHNQLVGHSGTLGTPLRIRSTYVGGIKDRCTRSIPPLQKLYAQSTAGMYSDNPETNSLAQQHAAFFLTRMYAAASDSENVIKWAKVVAEICGTRQFSAPAWTWYSHATLLTEGMEPAKAIIDQGLRRFPKHPDLIHQRIGIDFRQWYEAAMDERNFLGTPLHTRHLTQNAKEIIKLFALPVNIE